jgi:hypothetical protein
MAAALEAVLAATEAPAVAVATAAADPVDGAMLAEVAVADHSMQELIRWLLLQHVPDKVR